MQGYFNIASHQASISKGNKIISCIIKILKFKDFIRYFNFGGGGTQFLI